ncbi:RsmF rRNA methyltransferase first C-terminal domain-containing protein [Cellulosilyticum sp. I15G10I2]|uniref:RsmF rRNA methyltransferase first C-terminal domain-containing protein n=1 Tax=Cellulosilyticum sp. I15G10I2 TaxID=1892843 RepID=UPI00085BDB5A|nr:RsmB/NOP family class I SAM-dependent RNA methyltransferase [Cellulosilyticum sp. I15G10I2]
MKLPLAFESRMKNLLKEEYEDYLKSYDLPKYQGFRVNTLKISLEEWEQIVPFQAVKKVPWCNEGFYYDEVERPAKHPYYYAGLFYIQEPSAMAPGEYIPIKPGDKVLDLCAAPGGKSTQIAARLAQTGLLVSNDISATRAKGLLKNIENFGARNVIITNETPERLANRCPAYFDKILIDAPCSGEGMFRKSEEAMKNWETYTPEYCCNLQRDILEYAAHMLKPSGMLLYSTCTFSPEENEGMINEFLTKYPEFKVVPLVPKGGILKAHPEWVQAKNEIEGALRLWPHHLEGEGHFVCLLQKQDRRDTISTIKWTSKKRIKDYKDAAEFIKMYTYIDLETPVQEINNKLYLVAEDIPDLSGLRIVRSGLLIGELKNKRFEPYHALALAYPQSMFKQVINMKSDDANVIRYLKGETLLYEAQKGYHVICIDGYPLGWVKAHNSSLKNQYPPSWRMMG